MSGTSIPEGLPLDLPDTVEPLASAPAGETTPPSALLPPLEVDDAELAQGVAGILFVTDEPITPGVLSETLGVAQDRIAGALTAVQQRFEGLGVDLVEVAGGWRLMTSTSARPVLERWIVGARHGRLTQAALETLAVVAYRQPIARVTVGEIRGVNPDGALRSLMARGLVAEVGREDGPGQAVLFGTTGQFLERMGLRSLEELPPLPPYLPDGPAPDEPEAGGLAELRRRLRDGSQRLGGPSADTEGAAPGTAQGARLASAGMMDDDDDEEAMAPPIARARRTDEAEIVDLSERLEQAARSAMGRLRDVKATQARADAPSTPAADEDDGDGGSASADETAGAEAPGEGPSSG